jgi:hypothetical protein
VTIPRIPILPILPKPLKKLLDTPPLIWHSYVND